jgi:hypothetical protein
MDDAVQRAEQTYDAAADTYDAPANGLQSPSLRSTSRRTFSTLRARRLWGRWGRFEDQQRLSCV